jgi:hypothetical protein
VFDDGYEIDASELKFIFQPGVYRVDAPVRVKESMEPGSRCITLLDENMTVNLLSVTDTHIEIDSPVHGFLPMVNPRTGLCTLDMDNIVALDAGYVEPRNSCEIPVKTSKMKLKEFSENPNASRQSGPNHVSTQPSRTETIVCDEIPFKKRVPEKHTTKTSDTPQSLDEVLVCSNMTPESGSPVKTSEPAEKKTPEKKRKKTKKPEEDLKNVKKLRRVSGFGGLKYFEGEQHKVKKKRKVKKIVAGYKLKYWTKPVERKESETLIALRQNSRKKNIV